MTALSRFLLASAGGLILGLIIHLVVILAMPSFSNRDAFGRLNSSPDSAATGFVLSQSAQNGLPWLHFSDPASSMAVCSYHLDKGPYIVSIRAAAPFQSVSFHTRGGGTFFAVTDRAEVRGQLDFILATDDQMEQITTESDYDELYSHHIRVPSPSMEGLVVIRSLAPSPSFKIKAENALALADCRRLEPGE